MTNDMRRSAGGIATAAMTGGLCILAVVGRGEAPAAAAVTAPLPHFAPIAHRPMRDDWTRRSAHLTAVHVDLDSTGAHTHDNWIFFRLPFDSTDRERIRSVQFEPSAMVDPDVAAIRIGNVCTPSTNYGPIKTWAGYTAGAVGPSLAFADHPTPPTYDSVVYGLNVPSRVANYVACGWGQSEVLRDRAAWHLDVSWEER